MLPSELKLLDDFPPVSYEQWREVVEKDLKGAPFEKKLITHTYEGIDMQPVYAREDWPSDGDPSGFPAGWPHTRGGNPVGNAVCGWDVRQEHLLPEPAQNNKAILDDLARGVTSIQLRIDAAARRGIAHDQPKFEQFAGRDGCMVHHLADLDAALKDVRLGACGLGLEAGAAFLPAAATVVALLKQRGVDLADAWGAFNADPLAVYVRDGELPMPVDAALSQVAALAKWTSANMPRFRSVRVGSGPYHHAGATAAQDLGISMATAITYLRALTDAGLDINAAARQLLFAYSLGCNQFLAIAKLRAARRLWARVLEASGADLSPDAGVAMVMHARTSKRVITARDPWVNMLRNTVTTFAAAVAGADIVTTEPFDKAIGLSDDFSRRIARNTQVILGEESHLSRVIDPSGGCWFIEKMTDEVAEKGWAVLQDIERQGGMVKAIESGWIHEQIDSAFAPRLKNIARRKDAVTGVSEFPNLREKPVKPRKVDYDALVAAAKRQLSGAGGDACSLAGNADPMPAAIDAAAGGATISRMLAALKGEAAPATTTALYPFPYAKPFEELRDASDNYLALTGARPKVFLANMGPIAHHTVRATYTTNFFEAGGFEVITNNGFVGDNRDDFEGAARKAAQAFADSGANIAVICSSDVIYPNMVPAVTPELKKAGARTVILAGHPGENKETYDQAGVDRYIYISCDVLTTLRELLDEEGVLK